MDLRILALVSFLLAPSVKGIYTKRCVLYRGECVIQCPNKMHAYHTRCDTPTMSQRTCDNPIPYTLGYTCGWSRCDCNDNYALDKDGHCVKMQECFSALEYNKLKSRRRKAYRESKKIHIPADYNDEQKL